MQEFALLNTFRSLFQGTQYKHRDSSLGDLVASQLYEWLDYSQTAKEYGALLVRVSREYDRRFP